MSWFDPDTVSRWEGQAPRTIYQEARTLLQRAGAESSGDFLEAFQELVDVGLLTWDQIDECEGRSE